MSLALARWLGRESRGAAEILRPAAATMVVIAFAILVAGPAGAQSARAAFQAGLDRLAAGDAAAALASFRQALAFEPTDGAAGEGGPSPARLHLYAGVALEALGDLPAAESELEKAERLGFGESDAEARILAQGLRRRLFGAAPPPGESSSSAREAPSTLVALQRRNRQLSAAELATVQDLVRERCGVDAEPGASVLPWYFFYELGLEYAQRQDYRRARDVLLEALEKRRLGQRSARLYGMWFKDYLPQYHLAVAYAAIGETECALRSLQDSTRTGEIRSGDPEYATFLHLEEELQMELSSRTEAVK